MVENIKNKDKCQCSETFHEEDYLEQVRDIIKQYENEKGALIPILQSVQNLYGYLPELALKEISKKLKMPFSEIAGVVSFYSFFSTKPKGKYTIRVCLGTACYVRGGKELLNTLSEELKIKVGETTSDGKFTLDVGRCFGACGMAPVIMINDVTYQRVKPSKISEILSNY